MDFLVYIIPFVVAIFLLFFFKKEVVWWEYVIMIGVPILVSLIIRLIMIGSNTTDIEYLGDYITKVRHYEDWDEWVHKTCTRTYKSGNTTRTQTYDCSYRRYHPERWTYFDQNNKEHRLKSKEDFNEIVNKFKTKKIFVDMNRRYFTKDGDAEDYYWDKTKETFWGVTHEETYKNKVQCSRSVFNFEDISKKEADTLGLYDYPLIEKYDQNPILSKNKMSQKDIDALKYLNGFYGKKYQFRTYVLIFENEDVSISELQRSYWKGGNKNELVVCLGVADNEVKWCNAFSWEDIPVLEVKSESYFVENPSLNLEGFADMLKTSLLNNEWKRKSFEDFDYIRPELTMTQEMVAVILSIIINVVIAFVLIFNDIKNNGF